MSLILTDIAVRRQVLLERFKAAEVRKFTPILRKIDEEIRKQLSGDRITDFRRARLESQLAALKTALKGHYTEYTDQLTGDLRALATDAAAYEKGMLSTYVPKGIAAPAPQQLWAAVTANPLTMTGANGGMILESFMTSWAEGDAEMVANTVRVGYALGETNDQIISRIRGQAALSYSDGVLAKSRHHAEAVARTAIQHVANSARAEVWAANDDIIDEYQWVSTLDSRTTPLCRDRDGKKFPVGKGPLPPAHPNCRSTTVAVIKGDFGKFLEEESERASVNGPVPANETYYDWLSRQPHDFQDLALGSTRGKLFRDGGLTPEKFSALQLGKNFEPMTLEQMRTVAPGAFAKAGLADAIPEPALPAPAPIPEFVGLSRVEAEKRWKAGKLTAPIKGSAAVAAKHYSENAYKPINEYLRTGVAPSYGYGDIAGKLHGPEVIKQWTADIARHLEGSTLAESVSLYRGMDAQRLVDRIVAERFGGDALGDEAFALFGGANFSPATLVGEVFDDGAFMSFSVSKDVASNFGGRSFKGVTLRLEASAGERGYASMKGVTGIDVELEVLRKGGRFKITGWDPEQRVLIIRPLP